MGGDDEGLSYAPMDTDDLTLGLMMDCWVKIICRRDVACEKRQEEQIMMKSDEGDRKCWKSQNENKSDSRFAGRSLVFLPAGEINVY